MVPAHVEFDLRRDHGFRSPPVLPFRVPGAPGAWQQGTAPPSWSSRHRSPQSAAAFNFRRAPAPWGLPEARLRHPYMYQQPQPQARAEGPRAKDDANVPRRSSPGRDGSGGGEFPPRDGGRGRNGGVGGETEDPAASAPLSTRGAAGGGGGGHNTTSGLSALDATPAGDRVREEGEQAEGGREASVAADALLQQPAEATTVAAAAERRLPHYSDHAHPEHDTIPRPVAVAPGVEAACLPSRGGRTEEVIRQRDVVLGTGVEGAAEEQDGEDEDGGDPDQGWAMSREWEDHLRRSPSVQRYLQRMQAKPSTWKDGRGGKKVNKKKSGKKSAAGGGGGGSGGGGSNSVGAAADSNAEQLLSKVKNVGKTPPASSSKQQQQQQAPAEKKGGKKKPSSSKRGRNASASASAPAPAPASPSSSVADTRQALELELELAKIEANALLYAEQQQHRLLEDAVIIPE